MSRKGRSELASESDDQAGRPQYSRFRVALLTGCQDRHYAFGLAMALSADGISVDFVGSDELDSPELHTTSRLRFLNFRRGYGTDASISRKVGSLVGYYVRLFAYVLRREPKILHVLWNYKLEYFDRTILMLFYRLAGKSVILTAHNVNQARRDRTDSWWNRMTLKIQYRLCDHILVHTERMKEELCCDFAVAEDNVTVIRYPLNNAIPDTGLSPKEAKKKLGLREEERAILFFGRLVPYKGIEDLLEAYRLLWHNRPQEYKLILAGEPKKGAEAYLRDIQETVRANFDEGAVVLATKFIPDEDIELYLNAADVLVLPYKEIFQSGILIMAYGFGLPVVATDVGSFAEDVLDGRTGFLCRPGDPAAMASAIDRYFSSDLYRKLDASRKDIREHARASYSWRAVSDLTVRAYARALG